MSCTRTETIQNTTEVKQPIQPRNNINISSKPNCGSIIPPNIGHASEIHKAIIQQKIANHNISDINRKLPSSPISNEFDTKIKQSNLETDKTTEDTSDKEDVIEVEEGKENEIADAHIFSMKSTLSTEFNNAVHDSLPNSEELEIMVLVGKVNINSRITGGTEAKKCVDHEWITQMTMTMQLIVDHERITEVDQLQKNEQRDEFNQANMTDGISNSNAGLASIVAKIHDNISVLLNRKEHTLKEIAVLNPAIIRENTLANVFDKMGYLSTFTLNFEEYEELSLHGVNLRRDIQVIMNDYTLDLHFLTARVTYKMFYFVIDMLIRKLSDFTEMIQTLPLLVQLFYGTKGMFLKIRNLLIEPMHRFKQRTQDDDINDIIKTLCIPYKKIDKGYFDIKMPWRKLNLDNNTFPSKALFNLILLQKENSKVGAMFCKVQILNYFLKADINEQNSEIKTKQDSKKKLVGAKYTKMLQCLDKHFFKTLDNKLRAIILDGYKDTHKEQKQYTTAIDTHARTMEKQNKTSKTAKEPSREKMPSNTRVHSAQPDGGSVEILDGRNLADLLLPLKDRPHVGYPASHPLLMAKIRFIGQSSELNSFLHRIRSFVLGENPGNVSWPDDAMVRPLPLACSGFSYEGNGKEIVCKYCGFKTDTDSWHDNDEKYGMSIHRKAGTFCPFMNSFIDSEVVILEDDDELDQEQSQVNTLYFLFCRPETCFQDIKILNTFFTSRRIQHSQPIITEELVDKLILNEFYVKQKIFFDKYFSNGKKRYRKNM